VNVPVRISIEGVATGGVLGPTRVFSSNLSADRTIVGVSLLEAGNSVILLEPSPDLPNYDLRSAVGPTLDDEPFIEPGLRAGVPTEFGTVRLETFGQLTFAASLPVPEPSAIAVLVPTAWLLFRRRLIRFQPSNAGAPFPPVCRCGSLAGAWTCQTPCSSKPRSSSRRPSPRWT
jgi:hypothetical protein